MGAWGVGMPAALYLDEFGSQVWSAFGHAPFLVGSATKSTAWRDVDVRLILPDDEWDLLFGCNVNVKNPRFTSAKWTALCLAFSALGKQITGLPIDFQIQQMTQANAECPFPEHPRNALGHVALRHARDFAATEIG